MIKLLTTTGGRPEAWELCKRWVRQQTRQADAWIIVDDCAEMSDMSGITIPTMLVRPQPFWQPGQNTQARNLLAALESVTPNDTLIIIEDDDYYAPTWVQSVVEWSKRFELVGERNALYYHVGHRQYRSCGNLTHASLCSTAMRGSALEFFKRVCQKNYKFIDMQLWRNFRGSKKLFDTKMTTGIKGLPGRAGIGGGHRMSGRPDPNGELLKKRIGDDASVYR